MRRWRWVRRIATVAPWATTALIICAPELLGGAFAWCVPVIAVASLLCLGLTLAQSGLRQLTPPPLLWAALGTTMWTALQLVPLGSGVLSKISPERGLLLRLVASALGSDLGAGATAITYDPAATQLELLKGCSLLCTFVACYALSRRGHARLLLSAAGASGLLMALVALGHRAVDARSIFGVYRWTLVAPRLPAPILNDNCLAGFMVLTTPVALGLALSTRDARARAFWFAAAFTSGATGLLTGSRAGTGAMVFALVGMAVAAALRPRMRRERWKQAALASAILSSTVAAAVLVGAEPLLQALRQADYSKLDAIQEAFVRTLDNPWFGVGRGGFSVAMASTMSEAGRFVHAESFIATWASEWGIPVAALLLLLTSAAVGSLCLERSILKLGAGIALVAFGAQNLLDLSVELIGIATVAAAILATAMGDGEPEPTAPVRRVNLPQIGLVTTAMTVAFLSVFGRSAVANGDDLNIERLQRAKADPAAFRAELTRALQAHPLEPVLFMAGANEAILRRDPAALRWLNLAMLRAPDWSAPHAEASGFLLALGRPGQAALEAREAAARNPREGARATCAVATAVSDPELVLTASKGALAGASAQDYFDQLFHCLPPGVARAVDLRLLEQAPHIDGPALREYRRLVGEGNARRGLELLKRESRGKRPPERILLAYIGGLLNADDLATAETELARARELGFSKDALARLSAELATRRGDVLGMRAAIEELRAESASSGRKLSAAAVLLAGFEERLGNLNAAETALEDAAMLDPGPAALQRLLAFMRRRGNPAKALRIRASICAMSPANPECRGGRR